MHFKRTIEVKDLRNSLSFSLPINFESVVFLYTNKLHWDVCLVNECLWPIKYFTINCFSKILQDNKYNTFIAEIESNNIFIFFEKIYLNTIFHTPDHYDTYAAKAEFIIKCKVYFP